MNPRPQESEEYSTFLGYEIFDEERFKAWSGTMGFVCGAVAFASAFTSQTPAELVAKCSLTALMFAGSVFIGMRREDRDVQKARVSGRNSVFNGYRQIYPQAEETFSCNSRRLIN